MSPVESMAAGKPVLGVNDGGLKESIINKKTGLLIDAEAKIEDIVSGIEFLTPKKCLEMKKDCEKRAKDFSLKEFEKKLKEYIR
jgi:glycosyltransferase involved in cell wall biosynthesis